MLGALLNLPILVLALPLSALAANHGQLLNRHHADLAKRADGNVTLSSRGYSAWTFYETQTGNAGSCGQFLSDSGFTVAMNIAQMNSGLCGKQITMTCNGKTTVATIMDTCPGCQYGGLDLTPGLFQFFAPLGAGVIHGDWELGGAPPPPPPPPPPPAYTPPPPPPPPPPPTTTSVWVAPKPTTTTTWSAKPSSSSSVAVSSSKPSISAASPTPSVTPSVNTSPSTNNMEGLYQSFIELGGLILSGNQLSSS